MTKLTIRSGMIRPYQLFDCRLRPGSTVLESKCWAWAIWLPRPPSANSSRLSAPRPLTNSDNCAACSCGHHRIRQPKGCVGPCIDDASEFASLCALRPLGSSCRISRMGGRSSLSRRCVERRRAAGCSRSKRLAVQERIVIAQSDRTTQQVHVAGSFYILGAINVDEAINAALDNVVCDCYPGNCAVRLSPVDIDREHGQRDVGASS